MAGCFKWLLVVAAFVAVAVSGATAEIQCSDALSQMLPCEGFLLGGDATPSGTCCSAVQSLQNAASESDRKAICECFKEVAKSVFINLYKAQQIPQLCHVSIGVAIDPNVDCNKIGKARWGEDHY